MARLTIDIMRWMHTQEFSTFEKSGPGKEGILSWPHWHWGVLSMYGAHVALNQIGSYTPVMISSDTNGHLDFMSTSDTKISDHSVKGYFISLSTYGWVFFFLSSFVNVIITSPGMTDISLQHVHCWRTWDMF